MKIKVQYTIVKRMSKYNLCQKIVKPLIESHLKKTCNFYLNRSNLT